MVYINIVYYIYTHIYNIKFIYLIKFILSYIVYILYSIDKEYSIVYILYCSILVCMCVYIFIFTNTFIFIFEPLDLTVELTHFEHTFLSRNFKRAETELNPIQFNKKTFCMPLFVIDTGNS